MTISYELRHYDESDYDSVVSIALAIDPDDFVSVAEIAEWDGIQRQAGRLASRWHALADGRVIGSSYAGELASLQAGTRWINVAVYPEHQRRGIGRELLRLAEGVAVDDGGSVLLAEADDRLLRSARFLEAAGYEEINREWHSTLDLGGFDDDTWVTIVDGVKASGIGFVSVAELEGSDPAWLDKLHALYTEVEADVPFTLEFREMPFADFERRAIRSERALLHGFLVALDGDRYVGLTEPRRVDDRPEAIAQELTGVTGTHRGRGIATALKADVAMWAKIQGYRKIRTGNDSLNAPMLAVNAKLGFERDHGAIIFLKQAPG